MSQPDPNVVLRLAEMTRAREFALRPDADARAQLADLLGVSAIRKLMFTGSIAPEGKRDWLLTAELGATVVQPCVVTFAPVTTRIDQTVTRRYLAEIPTLPEASEVEMTDDETDDPLPAILDLSSVMAEALSLALPDFPRVEGASVDDAAFTEPGKTAMTDEDARPFASLKEFREKLSKKDD